MKHILWRICKQYGFEVEEHHAGNGIFRENKWVAECARQGQRIMFIGVNAHHTNCKSERMVRSLSELSRLMMINAKKRRPSTISGNLCPYVFKMATEALNEIPSLQDSINRTPVQKKSESKIIPNSKHWKPFGCPVYVLAGPLQLGRDIFHRWKERGKVGIYLGLSSLNAKNVALVLD